MKILVQKFGGTSLSSLENRRMAANKIIQAKKAGYTPVIVVAGGLETITYATETLVSMVKTECSAISQRELDMMISCGETIGGIMLTATLNSLGLEAILLNGQQAGIVTTSKHGDAQILGVKPGNIVYNAEQGKIVVVTGLQGISEYGEITTLGRGGGDTSAVAIGAAIGAKAVDIFIDSDGIMTAEPDIVSAAKVISTIAFEEAYQMAALGSQVLHPRVVEIAMRHNLPLRIKSVSKDGEGTTIFNRVDGTTEQVGNSSGVGIVCQSGFGLLRMYSKDESNYGYASAVFKALADLGASRDFISITPAYIDILAEQSIIESIQSQGEWPGVKETEVLPDCSRISLILSSRTIDPGIFSSFVEILRSQNINILRTYTIPFGISAVISKDHVPGAMSSLHKGMFGIKKEIKLNFLPNIINIVQRDNVI